MPDGAATAPTFRPFARTRGPGVAQGERLLAYGLLLPAALTIVALIGSPLFKVAEFSAREGRTMNFARIGMLPIGWGNYRRIAEDPAFWHSVLTSALYVGISIGAAFLIGLGTALLLNRPLRGRRWFRTLLLIPWAVPGVV